jgi:hypothetical protein
LEGVSRDTSHTSVLNTIQGCDSLVTIHLTVHRVDTVVTVESITLTAREENAGYQWVDCNDQYAPVDGATERSFTPTENGSYAVIVTEGSCTDTSSCHAVTTVDVPLHMAASSFEVFPVPAHNSVTLRVKEGSFSGTVVLMNVVGKRLYSTEVQEVSSVEIPLDGMQPGIYFLKITGAGDARVFRLMKE